MPMKAMALLKQEMVTGIKSVLDGHKKRFKTKSNITPSMVENYLEKRGWEKGQLETNGWQYDWWLPFTKDGKSYTAFGGGYYGGLEFFETEE
jgi:hypothetical protein